MQNCRNRVNIYFLFFIALIFCIFQYSVQKIWGFSIYPDEFGYWASAAQRLGYDWSELASMGSYYSFGYSLILTPILKLFSDGVIAYRAAIAVNMILMCVSLGMIWQIVKCLFPQEKENVSIFAGGLAVLYPGWIFYMQMTLIEALLMFLYVSVCYFFVSFVKKPRVLKAALLAAILSYLYVVHMRTVATVIACVISLAVWAVLKPEYRKKFCLFAVFLIGFGIAVVLIKENVLLQVYTGADKEQLAVNDYAGQWSKIKDIVSLTGIKRFLMGCIGKLFYMGMASFGIFYFAIIYVLKKLVSLVRNVSRREETEYVQWFCLFLLLSAIGQFVITAIYMYEPGRIDCIVYGRYNEFLVPIFLAVGILEMRGTSRLIGKTVIFAGFSGLAVPVINHLITSKELSSIQGAFMVGISYMLKEKNLEAGAFFGKAWLLGCGFMILVAVCVWLSQKWKFCYFILVIIVLLEVCLGIQASEHYTYKYNAIVFADKDIADEIEKDERSPVYYLYEGKEMFVDSIQFLLRDRSIKLIREEVFEQNGIPKGSFVIADIDTAYQERLDKYGDKRKEASSFLLYYMEDKSKDGF